jgi:hypothetical protein
MGEGMSLGCRVKRRVDVGIGFFFRDRENERGSGQGYEKLCVRTEKQTEFEREKKEGKRALFIQQSFSCRSSMGVLCEGNKKNRESRPWKRMCEGIS